jgi:hypothetical protein
LQTTRLPFSLALDKAGSNNPAKIAMMAITTSNSMSVKPEVLLFLKFCSDKLRIIGIINVDHSGGWFFHGKANLGLEPSCCVPRQFPGSQRMNVGFRLLRP